jgi:hypothetical protein
MRRDIRTRVHFGWLLKIFAAIFIVVIICVVVTGVVVNYGEIVT